MASIERTAYPRFRRLVTARELAALSPTEDEVAWARARARSPEHVLALVLSLKCFQRLGYFPRLGDVPSAVVDHVRRDLELPEGTNVSISPEVMILGLSHDYNDPTFRDLDAGPVTIEDYVWIGSRAMILPGVTVGRGAVVAAGSIVTKNVAPMTVVAGVPAKPVAIRDSGATAYTFGPPPLFE